MKLSKEEYLKECLKFLDYFSVDYSGDAIRLTSGGNSIICNPKSKFAKLFGGYSVNNVAEFVAKELGKETVWDKYDR
jgi:hypothetical protein